MTKIAVLFAVVACSESSDTKPAAVDDPWATKTKTTRSSDDDSWTAPWKTGAKSAPAETAPASGGASALAGSYQCQQLRYGTSVNGMRQSTYVASALGVFEVDGDGSYRSASYRAKGTGRARLDGTSVTFDGGPYPNAIGQAGTNSSNSFYIRFSENLTDAPAPNLRFNDHMCYRK